MSRWKCRCCSQGHLSGAHSCTARTPEEDERRRDASQTAAPTHSSRSFTQRNTPRHTGGGGRSVGAVASTQPGYTRSCLGWGGGTTSCVRGPCRCDVGVPGGSVRGAARQQRESRGGRALAGRQAVPGRALLRVQPERAVQAVQREPVRVLQPLQEDVRAQGQTGHRLHLVGPGPETLAGLFAGDALARVTFQRQTQKGKRATRGHQTPPPPPPPPPTHPLKPVLVLWRGFSVVTGSGNHWEPLNRATSASCVCVCVCAQVYLL